ncbi:hypothetical protein AHiyo4_15920 [Arthrobacter sp. Hiyo4]|nr:hypothetical protein AHiyo4_15920 [Arthrobacter sp. Hiyo4]
MATPTARLTSSTEMPSQPASSRAYSGLMAASRICATTGADSRSAATRPSTVSRLWRLSVALMANSNSGRRVAIRSRTAASPLLWRRSQGSAPVDSTAT